MRVATVEPATFQLDARPSAARTNPSIWLPLSPMNTAAGRLHAQVVGQEAQARETDAEGDRKRDVVWVNGHGVDREVGTRDRREGRGEPVHVVEQVEGVRHPDEPQCADRRCEDPVGDDLHADAHR